MESQKSEVEFIISDPNNPYIHIWMKYRSLEKCMPSKNPLRHKFLLFAFQSDVLHPKLKITEYLARICNRRCQKTPSTKYHSNQVTFCFFVCHIGSAIWISKFLTRVRNQRPQKPQSIQFQVHCTWEKRINKVACCILFRRFEFSVSRNQKFYRLQRFELSELLELF